MRIFDALRNANVALAGQQHHVRPREPDVGAQPHALAVQRILRHLHQQLLLFVQHLADVQGGAFRARAASRHVALVQEARPRQADVHERRLNARHYAAHPAPIEIADQTGGVGALHMQFQQLRARRRHIFANRVEQRYAGLEILNVD